MTTIGSRVGGGVIASVGGRVRPGVDGVCALAVRSRPIARRVARGLSLVTAFGWAVLGAAVVGWSLGRLLGWEEFTIAAAVLVVALVAAAVFVIGRSAYAVTLDLASTHVVVGQPAVGRLDVRNAHSRPLLPARIELPVGPNFASFHLPRLVGGATHEELFTIPTSSRAVLTVGPVRSVRDDPFGLLRRQVVWTKPEPLYVHPRTVPLDGASSGFLQDLDGLPTKDLSTHDVAFHALREYVPGDDRRYIHWKTTARTGIPMVRQFEETRRSHLALALSTTVEDYATADEFELAISACGSLALQAVKEEKELSVLTHDGSLRAATPTSLLNGLSGVEATERRENIVQLALTTSQSVPDASVLILLFGSSVSAEAMWQAGQKRPPGAIVAAVRCSPGASLERRVIGELIVLTIGSIDEFPAAMRRLVG